MSGGETLDGSYYGKGSAKKQSKVQCLENILHLMNNPLYYEAKNWS